MENRFLPPWSVGTPPAGAYMPNAPTPGTNITAHTPAISAATYKRIIGNSAHFPTSLVTTNECAGDVHLLENEYIHTSDVFTKPPISVRVPLNIVENTVGLQLLRSGQLAQTPSICFQHGYGKCKGRDGISSTTCRQIHVHRKALWELRRGYDTSNHQVRPLCRTIKVLLPETVRTSHAQYANLRYMEFSFEHTSLTAGRTSYLNRYTAYLLADDAQATFPLAEYLCADFAVNGNCSARELCVFIHASPHLAISRRERLQRWKGNSRGSNPGGMCTGESASCSSSDGGILSGTSDDFENILHRFAQCFNGGTTPGAVVHSQNG